MVRTKAQSRMTLSFPDEETRTLVQNIASDIAAEKQISTSAAIFNAVLECSLPPSDLKNSRILAERLYRGEIAMQNFLADAFAWNAAGTNWEAQHDNFHSLVQLAFDISLDWRLRLDLQNTVSHHFLSCLDSVVNKVLKENNDPLEGPRDSQDEPNQPRLNCESGQYLSEILLFVLNNWNCLGNYTYTFRMLGDLFDLANGWRDCTIKKGRIVIHHDSPVAKIRRRLVDTYANIEAEWAKRM